MAANTANCTGVVDATLTVGSQRIYRVRYLVETTDVDDQALIAIGASGIPSIGYAYSVGNESDFSAYVDAYSTQLVEENGSRKLWEVLVTFSTRPRELDDTQQPLTSYDYPWLAPARISGSGYKQEVQSTFHYPNPAVEQPKAATSSAGEVYDDIYKEESSFSLRIEIDYVRADWSLNDVMDYIDCVNASTFWGAPAGYYKMAAPSYRLLYTGQGIAYWNVSYDFEGKFRGWNHEPHVDEGTYYREISTGKLRRFEDDWRLSFAGKGKLDGSGTGYRIGYVDSQDRTEYWPPWQVQNGVRTGGISKYLEKEFANLNIPTSVEEVLNGR